MDCAVLLTDMTQLSCSPVHLNLINPLNGHDLSHTSRKQCLLIEIVFVCVTRLCNLHKEGKGYACVARIQDSSTWSKVSVQDPFLFLSPNLHQAYAGDQEDVVLGWGVGVEGDQIEIKILVHV